MKKIIPYGRQFIDQQDIISVTQSLMKDKITTGLLVDKFEKEINKYLKCKYSVTCNSGTLQDFFYMGIIPYSEDSTETYDFCGSYENHKDIKSCTESHLKMSEL